MARRRSFTRRYALVGRNKNMATGDALIKVNPGTAQILSRQPMVDPELYPKPIPYGGMCDPVNQNGFPTTSPSP